MSLLQPAYLPTIQSINQPTNHFDQSTNQPTNQKPAVTCCSSLLSSRTHYLIMPCAFFCCCNLPTLLPTNQPIYQPTYQPSCQSTNHPNNQKPAVTHSLEHSVSNYAIFLLTYLPNNQSTNQPTNHPTNLPTNLLTKTQQPSQPILFSTDIWIMTFLLQLNTTRLPKISNRGPQERSSGF